MPWCHRIWWVLLTMTKFCIATNLEIFSSFPTTDKIFLHVANGYVNSVPARLGKGQGAKEIGHNLACERPKFGHNPARERNEIWAQFCGRSMKTWVQICYQFTVHRLSENTKTEIKWKKKNYIRAGRCVNPAGRKGVRVGRKTIYKGRVQHPQKYA